MPIELARLESLFLGLADKTRLRLLALMANGPLSVGHLVAETGDSQPKVSRHLAYLRNAGLVETTRDGKWIYYGVAQLTDDSSDNVLRCVLTELSGGKGRRPSRAMPRQISENFVENRYEGNEHDGELETEWAPTSDTRSDELEIFLL